MDIENYTRTLLRNGFVLLDKVLDPSVVACLRSDLKRDSYADLPTNYSVGHYQQQPTFIPVELLVDPTIHNLIKNVLGSGYCLGSYTCNTNVDTIDAQPFHMDCSHYHGRNVRELCGCGPPHELIVNIYLQDTNEHNGSLDIIPGSHLVPDVELGEDGEVDESCLSNALSQRINAKEGSILIRDKRTWHRGMTNVTKYPRYMIGTRFISKWFRPISLSFPNHERIKFVHAKFNTENVMFTDVC